MTIHSIAAGDGLHSSDFPSAVALDGCCWKDCGSDFVRKGLIHARIYMDAKNTSKELFVFKNLCV